METNWKYAISRRSVLAGLVAIPVAGMAHQGHGASRVRADATVLSTENNVVRLQLEMVNLGSSPLSLSVIRAEGAADVVFEAPVEIKGFDTLSIVVELWFQTQILGVFTAYLDFGVHGQGPVLVMP